MSLSTLLTLSVCLFCWHGWGKALHAMELKWMSLSREGAKKKHYHRSASKAITLSHTAPTHTQTHIPLASLWGMFIETNVNTNGTINTLPRCASHPLFLLLLLQFCCRFSSSVRLLAIPPKRRGGPPIIRLTLRRSQ